MRTASAKPPGSDQWYEWGSVFHAANSNKRGVTFDLTRDEDHALRFIACESGLTPSFASGPFDALDAVTTSRLRDAYELLLVTRPGLDDDFDGLPPAGTDLSAIADADERRAALQDAVLDGWPEEGTAGQANALPPLPEQPTGLDPTAQFLARVLIPVSAGTPPARDGAGVVVDNWSRRFVASTHLLQRLLGI